MNKSSKFDKRSTEEARLEQVLNFCNHYLTLKSLHLPTPQNANPTTNNPNNNPSGPTKKSKRHKFEVATNKTISDQKADVTDIKIKAKKKKFEAPIKNNTQETSDFIPLQSLLSNLQPKSSIAENNFMSFGTSKITYNSNMPIQTHNYNSSYGNFNSEYNWATKAYNNSSSPIRLNPSRS